MINENKKIKDVDDFNCYAVEMWEGFLETFTKENGLVRDITEDDYAEETWSYIYTDRGDRLANRMRDRLIKVGQKHFPNEDIEIESHYYQEG